jgi:AAA family ATP:ADP antiporter
MTRHMMARWLAPFAEVKPDEIVPTLVLAARIFIILFGYYLLKPVREALILEHGTPELRSYALAAQAAVLLVAVPLYSYFFHNRVGEVLYRSITTFFAINLLIFYFLGISGFSIGFVFFIWLGIFSVGQVAQFWALAADVHSINAGQRLFAIIALGGSLGAVLGSRSAHHLFPLLGSYGMLLLAATLLLLTTLIYLRSGMESAMPHTTKNHDPYHVGGGFTVVLRSSYLRRVAIFIILLNLINSNGEFIFAKMVVAQAEMAVAAGGVKSVVIGEIYSNFFMWVNVLGLFFQAFVVSRLFRYIGVHWSVMILPVISTIGYGLIAFFPVFTVIRAIKILENSTDYSVQQTTRHALFLPVAQNEKYEGKTAIETFFWRFGDLMHAALIFVTTNWFGLSIYQFAAINMTIALFWIALAWRIGGEYRVLAANGEARASKQPA